jgi:ribonuclease PH
MPEQLINSIQSKINSEPLVITYTIGYNKEEVMQKIPELQDRLNKIDLEFKLTNDSKFIELTFNDRDTAIQLLKYLQNNKIVCYSRFF